jgi:hydroxyacylglutathione hydrolase
MSAPHSSSSSSGDAPSLDSVFQMKQYLTARKVAFHDCVEKSDLVRRCQETMTKQQQQQQSQMTTCDCAQTGDHSHADGAAAAAAAAAASSSSKPRTRKEGGALLRHIAVGPLSCNMTILGDPVTKEALLVDPGGDAEKILALVKEMGVTIKQILVTHAHFDHFLAAEEVRKATGAPVLLHKEDLLLWNALPMQLMMLGQKPLATSISAPDEFFTDGQSLHIRNGRVIHTPGHSPGSSCFYFPDDDLLCSGDTLFRQSVGRTDLMGGDSSKLIKSIQEKLYTLPGCTLVIPGHGPTTEIEFECKYNGVVRAVKAKTAAL